MESISWEEKAYQIFKHAQDLCEQGDIESAVPFLMDALQLGFENKKIRSTNIEDGSLARKEYIANNIITTPKKRDLLSVAGLQPVKAAVSRAIEIPAKYPQAFSNSRNIFLLYGLPGCGKSAVIEALAYTAYTEFKYTVFNINANNLLSKWQGDSEKMTVELFAELRQRRPSILIIDEIDQILSKRNDEQNDGVNRIKCLLLMELWGDLKSIVIIGATNRPHSMDSAIISRFTKCFFIPIPTSEERKLLFSSEMKDKRYELTDADLRRLSSITEGYSGRDIYKVVESAWMDVYSQWDDEQRLTNQNPECCHGCRNSVRPILTMQALVKATSTIKSSVMEDEMDKMERFQSQLGNHIASSPIRGRQSLWWCCC